MRIRLCFKGTDEQSFELITGVKKEFFSYPIQALRKLEEKGITAWPAIMGDCFSQEEIFRFEEYLRENGVKAQLELESLEAYPFVVENLKKRKIKLKK